MIQVSLLFSVRLYLLLSHILGVSLLPSRRFNPLYAAPPCPLAVLRSCFGYSLSHLRTAAACLSRCIRHRRRSKAKPLRGRQGRFRAVYRFNAAIISAFRTSSFTMSYEHNHRRNQWYRKGCREHHEQFSAAEGDCLEHRLQRRNIHRAQNYRRGGKRRQN